MTLNAPINIDLVICCFHERRKRSDCDVYFYYSSIHTKEDLSLKVTHMPIYKATKVNALTFCQYD